MSSARLKHRMTFSSHYAFYVTPKEPLIFEIPAFICLIPLRASNGHFSITSSCLFHVSKRQYLQLDRFALVNNVSLFKNSESQVSESDHCSVFGFKGSASLTAS